jgi:hypothetical protein
MFAVAISLGLLIVISIAAERFRAFRQDGEIKIQDRLYQFEMADGMLVEKDRRFNGIKVKLPKRLPHIYLDAHNRERVSETQPLIARSNRLSLEGDFDNHYQAYASPKHHRQALEILTPDFMSAVAHAKNRFDIEIVNDTVRIITEERVDYDKYLREELLVLAQRVIKELDHKLKTWDDSKLEDNIAVLDTRRSGVVRIGRTTIGLRTFFATGMGLLFFVFGFCCLGNRRCILFYCE